MLFLLKNRGVQVLLLFVIYLSIAKFLPLEVHQGLYTISLFIKDLLMWLLPLTVGFFIAQAVGSFRSQAPLFIISLVIFEALSNLSSVWYAYLGGHLAVEHLPPLQSTLSHLQFSELWRFSIARPSWWSADKGALIGLMLGCVAAFTHHPFLKRWIEGGKDKAQWILTRIFSRLIPIFVLGFVARMYQMNLFQNVLLQYSTLLLWLLALLTIYILAIFTISSDGTLKDIIRSIKNLLPAGGLALTSGCSISTMPWTIEGASKNLKNPPFAKAIIPATTNIQQIGDCITNTFLCFLLYTHFFGHTPDLLTWGAFSIAFVLARFATAAVIGGAIFIMLPIYEKYLSFNAEMIAIMLAFNVILDPLVTASNVIANGGLCRLYEKVWNRVLDISRKAQKEKPL